MLTEEQIYGIYVPVVTPFHAAGELDLESYQRYVSNIIKNNIHGLVVNGTTGESPTVNIQELQSLVDTSRELLKSSSIPLVVGTGTNDTYSTVARTELAANAGADAALVVVPYYSRPSQEGIIAHFRKAAEVGLPIMAYDIPGRTGVGMTLDTARTILEMNNVVGLKGCSGSPCSSPSCREAVASPCSAATICISSRCWATEPPEACWPQPMYIPAASSASTSSTEPVRLRLHRPRMMGWCR